MSWLMWLLDARLHIAGSEILWREIVGNGFGLASAIAGMRRRVVAWPVGMIGNVLLFTVFLGGVFDTPQDKDLWGQAGRQVFFFAVSAYGWWRWRQTRARGEVADGGAVAPRWATWSERLVLLALAVAGVGVFTVVFTLLGSWGPLPDAWIFTGSILATYGMARGWVEFWLIWIAVDAVGVPLLLAAGYYPSATLYLVYGGFCVVGFVAWLRAHRRLAAAAVPTPADAVAGGGPA
ncbi:nicotinamide riboside transporter PnuC [Thermasporomyces composti]|jgi:nicotinamide mononucleotide transporter|uniref:Nicotinamide mononucleotide transporter n=1 Tax=Thermasporomyces composti TaxID=696763 RepID=A0A3D9VLP7_THECX|nr:nicotinamide riboside transporter PnuC [Thermasporomyces composti]REF38301.1 nicotinamide mononucleotide transporter [Thermasporomyces composti]